ncbi:hypothetical protein N9Z53_04495, partial [Mariniblastus sp.]|nr:hypothetical protein [Mariniblastus sp.]
LNRMFAKMFRCGRLTTKIESQDRVLFGVNLSGSKIKLIRCDFGKKISETNVRGLASTFRSI